MGLMNGLQDRGYYPVGLHYTQVPALYCNKLPTLHGLKLREWMGVLHAADYVVSVDTAAFHCRGGMGKPLTGIYTFADGQVYGKWYDFHARAEASGIGCSLGLRALLQLG
jgi:hypothetical protein